MTHFVKHTACVFCHSSDAYAHYSDGSTYCFSCGKGKRASISPLLSKQVQEEDYARRVQLPHSTTTDYSVGAVEWLAKYNVSVLQAQLHGLVYCKKSNQLIFTFYDEDKTLLAYQARNLGNVKKSKRYFTQGDINSLLPIYHAGDARSSSLTLVEDCVSAIRVKTASKADAMPLLGSGISKDKLARLARFYSVLNVWLDSDMYHKALDIAQQASLLGLEAKVVYTEEDPKCYDDTKIKDYLK